MLVLGYQSGKSPVLMGYLIGVVVIMSYLSIHISNIYRELISNDVFRSLVVNFPVYNRIMMYFPWFVFIITLMSVLLGIINYQKTSVNSMETDLNY
jgi:hypothetical protein